MKYLKLKFLLMFFALAMAIPPAWAEEVTDVLTREFTGVSGTSYASWSGKTGTSGAVYAGNSAGGNNSIQLRSTNGSSIVTTKSGGKVKSITVTWNSNTAVGRTLNIYCNNTAYASLADFNNNVPNNPYGTIVYGTSTTLNINDDYNYIAIKSASGAHFIDKIEIVWETEDSSLTPVTLSFPESNYTAFLGQSFTAPDLTIDPSTAASEVTYSSSDESVATVDASGNVTPVAIGTTTITASISNSETYNNATASYTLTVKPDPDELAILDFTSPNYWTPALPEGSDNKFVEETEFSDGTYTVKVAGSTGEGCYWLNSGDALLIGKLGAYLQLPAFDKPVERIVIDGHSSASGKVTQNIFVGDVAVSTETTSAKVTQTYEIAPAYQAADNIYTLKVTNANNTQIQKIYVYFKEQSSDPELSVTPPSITINDEGGSFSVFGQNLGGDNVGVTRTNGEFKPVLSATTGSVTNHDEGYENKWWYFTPASDNGGSVNGKINVTYEGYGFSGEGSFSVGNGATGSKLVNVTYKPDIYIVGDYGINEGWNFTDGTNKMSEAGGVYSIELNVENTNTYVAFARKVGAGVGFNTRYVFTPVSDNNWEMDADSKEGTINVYGAKPIHFQYAGLYVIEINTNNSPATFTITRTLPQAAKPKITPNGGNFAASQTVNITTTTEGASIYYTTDESEPSAENGTLYEGEITLTATTTLKAIAVKEGMRPSEVATATFTKTGIDDLAGVIALGKNKNFTFVGNVVVTYVGTYGNHTLIGLRDVSENKANGKGGGVFYDPTSTTPLEAGNTLAPEWTGTTYQYGNSWIEINNANNITVNGTGVEVLPFDRTGVELTSANQSEYIKLRNVTIDADAKTATWSDGSKNTITYELFNRFDDVTYDSGNYEYLIGLVSAYKATPQIYPIELKKAQQDPELAFDEETPTTVYVGEEIPLTVNNVPEGATVTFECTPENAVTFDGNKATFNTEGEVTITAKTAETAEYKAGEVSMTFNVQAKTTPTLTFEPNKVELTIGDEFTAPTLNGLPEGATVQYTVENENPEVVVATVENNVVTITGTAGKATVTATYAGNNQYNGTSATYTIEVSKKDVTLEFGETPDIYVGNEVTLTVTGAPEGVNVTFECVPEGAVTFGEGGKATFNTEGEVTITAKTAATDEYNAGEVSKTFNVLAKTTPTLTFSSNNVELTIGETFTGQTVTGVPEGGKVTYTSSNPEAVEVNPETGAVTIKAVTTEPVTITATLEEGDTYNGTSVSYTITVNDVVEAIAAPTFSPAAGTYTEPKEVAIACATPGVTIEYKIGEGAYQPYTKPFTVGNENGNSTVTVTARAKMGNRTVYTPATAEATYTINVLPAATITDGYYNLINNALSGKYANVAGRRTLNFVDDPADKAGTVFRIETNNNGQVQTLRSQACDIQDYAKRAMNYVPTLVQVVINKLNNMDGVDDATGPGNILGENGLKALMDKFNECFDYNLYVEGGENAYRIYARTPSMQNVVDFYAEHKAQVDEKLPMLEGYINQVLAKIRSKVPAGMNANVFEPFSLLTVWEEMGGNLIKPDTEANVMKFYEQVLTNKEYVWNFAYTTAKHYLNNIQGTQTYRSLVAQYPDINIYVSKMEEIRPETKFFIIQNGNEPDYVSETHSYIKENLPMTYWTLNEREKFTVNVPEANKLNDSYYTTLYTDFGYELPEGVEAYAVTGIDANDVAQLTEITGTIPAQTPVLLKATAAGNKELTLKMDSRGGAVEGNLLEGPDYLIKEYGINSPTVEMLFTFAEPIVPADMLEEYAYLKLRTSGTVNNKYFWNVNDALDSCTYKDANNEDDCVVRSLAVKNGTLAFSEHWTTENNKAFLVSDTKPVIYLEKETLAAPTFSPVPGSYTVDNGENVTITITAEDDATIYYKIGDGEYQPYEGPITASDDMTIVAKAEKDGMIASNEVTAVYVIDNPTVLPDVPAMKGYYQIKNLGNSKYANVAGRKTLNFKSEDEAKTEAGTVIWLETNGNGQVQSIRSQAADLQRYADRAMSYVPDIVNIVVNKINEMNGIEDATGAGSVLGENGLGLIMTEFNKCFDHHLYVEPADGGYRLYGKTPNMQHVVDFYRAHTAQVEAKLLKLEDFINNALTILENKIGSNVFTDFSLHQIWENMGSTLTEPTDDASKMAFYREVLNNKNYVWDFAYQTAMIYLDNIKYTQTYQNLVNEHPEILQYIDKIDQIRPDFKYYVVQKNDKPDFISEGNVDIINNAARTIWTLEERTTFNVNIDENNLFGCPLAGGVGGYATTLYTDFAYNVPDGVTAYKVTSIEGGKATIEALSGIIPAQTPVLLTAKVAGTVTLKLTTEPATADTTGNLLRGPDYLINVYDLKTDQVQSLFDQIKQKLGQDFYDTYVAQYEYLADLNSGTVNNKYFWGLKESDVEKCSNDGGEDCVVRNLSGDKFIDNWKVETNKAFLVTDEYNEITFNTLHGDVNHDGLVNIEDVTDLIDRLLGMPDPYHLKACEYCSDVNKNGTVKIDDVTTLIDILLGIDGSNQATEPEGGE